MVNIMKKKVFAFVGSRSSKKITYSFVKKILEEMDHIESIEYEILTLADFDIHPCLGCENCFLLGDCVQKDDLQKLLNKILHADLFVLSAPVYMHGMPGEMKNIIDRIATWSHTFRLAGKNVILISTCNSNGHMSVINEFHLKLLYMGAQIVDRYVGTNVIPKDLNVDANLILLDNIDDKLVSEMVRKTVVKCNKPVETNRFLESLFQYYYNIHSELLRNDHVKGETQYWIDSGLLNCKSYKDYLELLLERKDCNND